MQYSLLSVDREREKTFRANKTHARSTYKERSLIFSIYILIFVSRILFVVVDRIYLFISRGYYSGLNNQLLIIKKRA